MARLIFGSIGLSYRGVRLAVAGSTYTGGSGVLTPPPGFVGIVSPDVPNQAVTSRYNDPARSYVPLSAWLDSPYAGGMRFKDYLTPQDGTVYYEIQVFARIDCAVDFLLVRDTDDFANFVILEGNRPLAQANSYASGNPTRLPEVGATVYLTPGLHTLRVAIMSGNSFYASDIVVRTT